MEKKVHALDMQIRNFVREAVDLIALRNHQNEYIHQDGKESENSAAGNFHFVGWSCITI